MSMDKNFSMGLQGGGQPAAGDDKPAALIDSFAGIFGINPRAGKGLDNFNANGLTGNDIFKDPSDGGKGIVSWSSKPKEGNWMQKIMQAAARDLGIGKFGAAEGSSGGGSSGGGSSGGGSSGGGDGGSFASSGGGGGGSTSTASAPVSSSGGDSSGVGGGRVGLSASIASLVQGVSLNTENMVGPAVQVHMDFTPTRIAEAPLATPAAPAQDNVTFLS